MVFRMKIFGSSSKKNFRGVASHQVLIIPIPGVAYTSKGGQSATITTYNKRIYLEFITPYQVISQFEFGRSKS